MKEYDIKRKLRERLPKSLNNWSGLDWLHCIGSFASIIGLVALPVSFYMTRKKEIADWESVAVAAIAIMLLLIFCFTVLVYSWKNLQASRYRYANAVHFFHYVSHSIRDYTVKTIRGDKTGNLDEELQSIVTEIANCFSIITGQTCRCCIKAIEVAKQPLSVKTFARDAPSASYSHKDSGSHAIDDNTDFSSLWCAIPPFERGYIANDLLALFSQHRYKNTSIDKDYIPIGKGDKIENWPLPYVSTLVVPIRYIADFSPPKGNEIVSQNWNYWGFLCIDCNQKNAFLDPDLLELAGGFADCIYSFVTSIGHHCQPNQ